MITIVPRQKTHMYTTLALVPLSSTNPYHAPLLIDDQMYQQKVWLIKHIREFSCDKRKFFFNAGGDFYAQAFSTPRVSQNVHYGT